MYIKQMLIGSNFVPKKKKKLRKKIENLQQK